MFLILPAILLASGIAFQTVPATPPPTPSATTPAGSPLPSSRGKASPKGANSELEGETKEDGVMSVGRYEGGSFSLKANKVIAYVNENEVVLVQGKQRFAIPVKAVAEVLDGGGVYAHVAAAAGAEVPNSNPKNNQTVVGVIWKDGDKKNGVVLRVDKGDFPNFVQALQSVTGLTAAEAK